MRNGSNIQIGMANQTTEKIFAIHFTTLGHWRWCLRDGNWMSAIDQIATDLIAFNHRSQLCCSPHLLVVFRGSPRAVAMRLLKRLREKIKLSPHGQELVSEASGSQPASIISPTSSSEPTILPATVTPPITTTRSSSAVGAKIGQSLPDPQSPLHSVRAPSPTGSQWQPQHEKEGIRPTLREASKTILRLVKESADAFPPLKSTAGGLLGLIDLLEVRLSSCSQTRLGPTYPECCLK
jgi:hypothetical protein